MARILGIGIAALDIINTVAAYPREDDEVRALDQRIARGGNVTNTLVVLGQLGNRCCWGGVLADERDAGIIRDDLARFGVDLRHVRQESSGTVPTSYITLNRSNGSRTIIHYRDLPEFGLQDFRKIDLAGFDWLHFEGRNVPETRRMLDRALRVLDPSRISVEIEKQRDNIESLCDGPGVLFFSKAYVTATGADSAADFLAVRHRRLPATELVCTWGADGAWGTGAGGQLLHRPAYPPPRVVDTIGAGDTFIAGYIDARLRGLTIYDALDDGCRLAGKKCGVAGFDLRESNA